MAGEDVGSPSAAHVRVQAPVVRPKTLHLGAHDIDDQRHMLVLVSWCIQEKNSSQCGVEPSPCLCQLAGRKHTGRRWRCQACGGTEKGARSCSTLCRSLHGQEAAHKDIIPDQKKV